MKHLLRACAAAVALLLVVSAVHTIAREGARAASPLQVAAAHGFEVRSVTGAPDRAEKLLKLYVSDYLASAEVDGSYTIDVAINVLPAGEDAESVEVVVIWALAEAGGQPLWIARQRERFLLVDINNFPDLIWPPAAMAVAPQLLDVVRQWEKKKTRS